VHTATLASILSVSASVGYPLLFAIIAAEAGGLPVPGETALITAAIAASQGHLQIVAVIAIAAGAAITGDNAGYLIGRRPQDPRGIGSLRASASSACSLLR
jgi:membrane protein DedA with SNARE-associated domain